MTLIMAVITECGRVFFSSFTEIKDQVLPQSRQLIVPSNVSSQNIKNTSGHLCTLVVQDEG